MQSLKKVLRWKNLGKSVINPRYALTEACIIGIVSALFALLLKQGIGWLGSYRVQLAHQWGAIFALPLLGFSLSVVAGWFTETFSPPAGGGGIPQVKAALARFPMPLSIKVAVVKSISTILVLGSGLTLGRRGPTVHIGAALAAQLSEWMPTSPEHRRQMIAAGAAAGLAAGFNTPIAGVLFVVEELMQDISGLTLETAIMASFTGAVVSRMLGNFNGLISPEFLDTSLPLIINNVSSAPSYFSAVEIPFYILLGIIAGILGGIFNRGILLCVKVGRQLQMPLPLRMGLAGLISGGVIACLPPLFWDNAGLRQFLMQGDVHWQITAIAFFVHFCLTLLAYGAGAPGGLFAPALVLGAALGYLVGMGEELFLTVASLNTFALAGMGAFFTGVIRVPVTAIVIIFEMTADFNLVLPLMIACAVSYIVAEGVSPGSLYQDLLTASGFSLKEKQRGQYFLTHLTAADVMQTNVEVLSYDLTVEEVLEAMYRSQHRGFPVVKEGILVGIVAQSDVNKLELSGETLRLEEFMTPDPITVNPNTGLSDVLYLLNRYQLSRLPVIEHSKLLGIITRTDIIRAEVQQLSGKSAPHSPLSAPSYTIYQTRSPEVGKGRILLFISQNDNIAELENIAFAIAKYYAYEIDCLAVMEIARHQRPDQTRVNAVKLRKQMAHLERLARHRQVSIHTEIKLAHFQGDSLIESLHHRHIKLMICQWTDSASTLSTLAHKIHCEILLIKPGKKQHFSQKDIPKGKWLIPTAGGANIHQGLNLIPALSQLYAHPQALTVWMTQVYSDHNSRSVYQQLLKTVNYLKQKIDTLVLPVSLNSPSVIEAIVNFCQRKRCDVVMLGASEESFFQQAIHGNIPFAIAKEVDATVILFRSELLSSSLESK